MQELVKKLMDETNLDEVMAKKVIEIVLGFMKDKLPSGIHEQIEKIVTGDEAFDLGDAKDRLKDLF